MRTRFTIAVLAVVAFGMSSGGARAASIEYLAVFEQRTLQGYESSPGFSVNYAYDNYRSLETFGSIPNLALESSPSEEHKGGYLVIQVANSFIFSNTVSSLSPSLPPDPLLLGGQRTLQYIVTNSGTPGCIGTAATLTININPTGNPHVTELAQQEFDVDGLDYAVVSAGATVERIAHVNGTAASCLGIFTVGAGQSEYATMHWGAGPYLAVSTD